MTWTDLSNRFHSGRSKGTIWSRCLPRRRLMQPGSLESVSLQIWRKFSPTPPQPQRNTDGGSVGAHRWIAMSAGRFLSSEEHRWGTWKSSVVSIILTVKSLNVTKLHKLFCFDIFIYWVCLVTNKRLKLLDKGNIHITYIGLFYFLYFYHLKISEVAVKLEPAYSRCWSDGFTTQSSLELCDLVIGVSEE